MKLLRRPDRLEGESHPGHVLRLAALNGLARAAWLPPEAIPGRTAQGRVLPLGRVRLCPECLQAGSVWREEWTIATLPVCLTHRCKLIDRCPQCKAVFRWRNLSLQQCRCGFRLEESGAEALAGWSRQFADTLADRLAPFASLSARDVGALVSVIGVGLHCARKRRGRKSFRPTDLGECLSAFEKAADVLSDWPTRFERYLEQALPAPGARRRPSPSQCYAGLYSGITHELAGESFQFLRDAFETFLAKRWPFPLTGRSRYSSQVEPRALPLKAVCEALHISGKSALRLARDAGVAFLTRRTSTGRRLRLLKATDVPSLAQKSANLISLRAAAAALGTSRPRVKELVDAGILGGSAPGRSTRMDRLGIERLRAQVWGRAQIPSPEVCGLVALPLALRHRIPRGRFAELVTDMLRGAVPIHPARDLVGPVFTAVSVPQTVVDRCGSSSSKCSDFLTVPQAAAALAVKQEVAYALVRNGLLASTCVRPARRRRALVARSAIGGFQSRFATAGELARVIGTSPRAAVARLLERGVRPVAGPAVDGCRQQFFRRGASLDRAMAAMQAQAGGRFGRQLTKRRRS